MIYLVESNNYLKLFYGDDEFKFELGMMEYNPNFKIIASRKGTRETILVFNNEHFTYRNANGWLKCNNKIIKDFSKL